MRNGKGCRVRKVQINLSEESLGILTQLREEFGTLTLTQTTREVLVLVWFLWQQYRQGFSLQLRRGSEVEAVVLPFLGQGGIAAVDPSPRQGEA